MNREQMSYSFIKESDPRLHSILEEEDLRQEKGLELIASENFVSREVLQAYTSTFTNKYAEGYPKKRYYGGCEAVDKVEDLALERAKKLFSAGYANVQPHSGAQANMAVFFAALKPGDTVLGMDLNHGGHLTHGSKVNFSGLYYEIVSYGVRPDNFYIDYDQLEKQAREHRPKLIIAGASAYPRVIDFPRFAEIAQKTQAHLMVDMAHIAGLVATGLHPSPMGYADFVTTTTHKTLRGPRGGLILSNKEEDWGRKLNSRLFPGVQGGPLVHVIAAKAMAFGEALKPNFKEYQTQVLKNARQLSETLLSRDVQVISGGTDNHIVLINVFESKGITGKEAQEVLEEVGITTNKNTVPFDKNPPAVASGIRLGSPALTTRGLKENEFERIAHWIADILEKPHDEKLKKQVEESVKEMCMRFPMNSFRLNSL